MQTHVHAETTMSRLVQPTSAITPARWPVRSAAGHPVVVLLRAIEQNHVLHPSVSFSWARIGLCLTPEMSGPPGHFGHRVPPRFGANVVRVGGACGLQVQLASTVHTLEEGNHRVVELFLAL
jgi:hypothetical protein